MSVQALDFKTEGEMIIIQNKHKLGNSWPLREQYRSELEESKAKMK